MGTPGPDGLAILKSNFTVDHNRFRVQNTIQP